MPPIRDPYLLQAQEKRRRLQQQRRRKRALAYIRTAEKRAARSREVAAESRPKPPRVTTTRTREAESRQVAAGSTAGPFPKPSTAGPFAKPPPKLEFGPFRERVDLSGKRRKNALDWILEQSSQAIEDVGAGVTETVGGAVESLLLTGGDPRKAREVSERIQAGEPKVAGFAGPEVEKAARKIGQIAGRTVGQWVQALAGLPVAPVALMAQPGKFLSGFKDQYAEIYGPLVRGDFDEFARKLEQYPGFVSLDAWAAFSGLTAVAKAAGVKVPGRVQHLQVDGGRVQVPTSPNPAARVVGAGARRAQERFPDAPAVGARSRAVRHAQIQMEREMERQAARAKAFAKKAKRQVKGEAQETAYSHLADHGWATPAERALSAEMAAKEIARKRQQIDVLVRSAQDRQATQRLETGAWVRAGSAPGRIVERTGETATVHFYNKRSGASHYADLPVSELVPAPEVSGRFRTALARQEITNLERTIGELEQALPFIREPTPGMLSTLKDGQRLSQEWTQARVRLGLEPEQAAERIGLHGRLIEGSRYVRPQEAAREARFFDDVKLAADVGARQARAEQVAPLEQAASRLATREERAASRATRPERAAVSELETEAFRASEAAYAARRKLGQEVEAAERRVAALERLRPKTDGEIAKVAAELTRARRDLKGLRDQLRRERRQAEPLSTQRDLARTVGEELRAKQEGAWRAAVVEAVASRQARKGLAREAERRAAEIDARLEKLTRLADQAAEEAHGGAGKFTAADYTPGQSAFFIPDVARQPIRSLMFPGSGRRLPQGMKQNKGILFTQGRLRRGPQVLAEHGGKTARDIVQLETVENITRQFAEPYRGVIPEGRMLWNPEGQKIPRSLRPEEINALYTPDEVARLLDRDYQSMLDNLFPRDAVEGVMTVPEWVERLFRERHAFFVGANKNIALRAIKNVIVDIPNNLFRLGIYAKPAYFALNIPANAVFVATQAVRHPVAFAKALKMYGKIPDELWARLDAEYGGGFSAGLASESRGVGTALTQAAGDLANTLADSTFRRAAFLTEAIQQAKVRTPQQLARLADDPRKRELLNVIADDAENAVVRFRFLHPLERSFLASWIAVYPWLRGATRYTWRFPVDHPLQASVGAHLGYEGYKEVEETMGLVASFLRDYAPYVFEPERTFRAALHGEWESPVRKTEPRLDEHGQPVQDVTDFGTLFAAQSGLDLTKAAYGTLFGGSAAEGATRLGQLATPAADVVTTAIFGRDDLGRETDEGWLERAVKEPLRFGIGGTISGLISPPDGGRYFEDEGRQGVLERFAIGSARQRTMRLEPARKRGREQQRAKLPRERRVLNDLLRHERQVMRRKYGAGLRLPPELVDDLNIKAKIDASLQEQRNDLARHEGIDRLPLADKITVLRDALLEYRGLTIEGELPADERVVRKLEQYLYPTLIRWRDVTSGFRSEP